MRPVRVEVIQDELAISWDDGGESFIGLERLRRECPCALCAGETDVLGRRLRAPVAPLTPASFQLSRFETVGGYAFQLHWGDGHETGIYPYDLLRRLGAPPA